MDNDKLSSKTAGKPIRCRAAVSRQPGEPLVIEEITVAPPGAYEVRIRIICTSLCHSDITFWKLTVPPACFPRILGHEAVGTQVLDWDCESECGWRVVSASPTRQGIKVGL
ncbi:hypothetical protein SLEP1_g59452 [Rubroshorea leprosula]|uniref:Alcohol dehydrogenase-like N-terminal domain-containing protein n=1 Tax=Rubroshorea leprosula TaxID=152421 RepID=A0AAV5MTI0_9ROSI|nr:hypothetical protein SLEP1_g59452 [Rubroshorea leprosula]